MKKTFEWIMWAALALPLVYLVVVWPQLPDIVPTHFGIDGQPDAFGSKWTLFILTPVAIGVYALLRFVPQLDPRLNQAAVTEHYPKLRLLLVAFLSMVHILIIRSAIEQMSGEVLTNLMCGGVFLLFAGIGNYLNNIKPNYFIGIRTPWTLESETVWRKTHQMGAKLFFGVGIIGVLGVVWWPDLGKIIWTLGLIFGMVLWILVYSYRVYKQEQKTKIG